MSMTIELPKPVEARLASEARKAGVSVSELVSRTLAEKFPAELDENTQALRLIEQWISEAPTDPERIQEAEDDLREFQRGIDQTRKEAGAQPVYSEAK